jgi:surface antigen
MGVKAKMVRGFLAAKPLFAAAILFAATFVPVFTGGKSAAAVTTQCSGFAACTTSPYTDHGWQPNISNSYWGQASGDNCTNYVAYYEQTMNGMSSARPSWLLTGHNAKDWATEASDGGITVSTTPVVGAIAQWGDYGWNDHAGHVGIVESVSNSGASIQVSWDSYSAGPYKWVQLNSTDPNTSTAVGWPNKFIYLGSLSGAKHWVPLAGDWDGNGTVSIGLYDPNTATFYLRNSNTSGVSNYSAVFGSGGNWVPIVGDWDGNGTTTIGVYDPSTARFYLSNSNISPSSDISSVFGNANWVPLVGNWDGYQGDTIGVYDPSTARFHLSNYNTSPQDNYSAAFGNGGNWVPLVGNWDGYQGDTIGVYNPTLARFYLSNYNTSPQTNYTVVYGSGGSWEPVVGDWDTNGTTTVGIYNPATATFYLSNSNTSGVTNISFTYGNPN